MAKKKTKKSKRSRAKARAPKATFDRPVAKAAPSQHAAAAAPKRGVQVDFREEYRYVLKDLRRLGILAAVMLVVLLALTTLIT